jgi:hypothetical protein
MASEETKDNKVVTDATDTKKSTDTKGTTDTTDNNDAGIDDSHISPVERRNSLERHLQHRPDPQDLKNRHILLDTNAAP